MTSIIGERIDEVVKIGLVPLLTEHGFAKKSRIFRKAAGEAIQIVNIQANKWNRGDSGSFTINLGVYFRTIEELADGWIVDLPDAGQFTAGKRLGQLMPKPHDKWWKLRPKRWWEIKDRFTPNNVAVQAGNTLRQYGLPWLEQAGSREGLRRAFTDRNSCLHSNPRKLMALEILDGNLGEAKRLIQAELTNPPANYSAFEKHLAAWGRKRGLI